jgi:hypothetical protein
VDPTRFRRLESTEEPVLGWFKSRALRKRLRSIDPTRLGELAEDAIGRLYATVRTRNDQLLTAPISHRACIYYAVGIYDAGQMIGSAQQGVSFVLEDEATSARAIVDLDHALVSVIYDHTTTCRGPFDADPDQKALLVALDLLGRSWFQTDQVVFLEGTIEPGDRITVLGSGVREADPDAGFAGIYRDGGRTRLCLRGSTDHPLVLSDDQTLHVSW